MMSKQVLSIEQMQHLQELGLELKDAMIYWSKPHKGVICRCGNDWFLSLANDKTRKFFDVIPAYTLQDVLDALPASIKHKDFRYHLVYNKSEGFIAYYRVDFDGNHRYARYEEIYNGIEGLSVIDATYSLLCWAIEQGYVETKKGMRYENNQE